MTSEERKRKNAESGEERDVKKYKYETHCHTATGSACSRFTAEEIVEVYEANGYSGVCITDHFLNGNTTVDRTLPYEEQIEEFCRGYEEVKRAAGNRLRVFFGFEYSYLGTDVLCYGWKKEDLKKLSKILSMRMSEFCDFCAASGVLAVQAHPFREAAYIDHIRLFPRVEGVEVFNACRNERCNRLGKLYAEEYGKLQIGGSDIHGKTQKILSGMSFDEEAESEEELIALLRAGRGEIVVQENRYRG